MRAPSLHLYSDGGDTAASIDRSNYLIFHSIRLLRLFRRSWMGNHKIFQVRMKPSICFLLYVEKFMFMHLYINLNQWIWERSHTIHDRARLCQKLVWVPPRWPKSIKIWIWLQIMLYKYYDRNKLTSLENLSHNNVSYAGAIWVCEWSGSHQHTSDCVWMMLCSV